MFLPKPVYNKLCEFKAFDRHVHVDMDHTKTSGSFTTTRGKVDFSVNKNKLFITNVYVRENNKFIVANKTIAEAKKILGVWC